MLFLVGFIHPLPDGCEHPAFAFRSGEGIHGFIYRPWRGLTNGATTETYRTKESYHHSIAKGYSKGIQWIIVFIFILHCLSSRTMPYCKSIQCFGGCPFLLNHHCHCWETNTGRILPTEYWISSLIFLDTVSTNSCLDQKQLLLLGKGGTVQNCATSSSLWVLLGLSPCPVTVTTSTIIFLVGDPYKPSFATVTGGGDNPNYNCRTALLGTKKHLFKPVAGQTRSCVPWTCYEDLKKNLSCLSIHLYTSV